MRLAPQLTAPEAVRHNEQGDVEGGNERINRTRPIVFVDGKIFGKGGTVKKPA